MLPRGRDVFSRVTRLPRRVSGAHDTYCYVPFEQNLLYARELHGYLYATRDRPPCIHVCAPGDAYQRIDENITYEETYVVFGNLA